MNEIKKTCKICGREGYRLTSHINYEHKLTTEEYYIYYILQSYLPPKCSNKFCLNFTTFRDLGSGFNKCCSTFCHVSLQNQDPNCNFGLSKRWKEEGFTEISRKAKLEGLSRSRKENPELWKRVEEARVAGVKRKWSEDIEYRNRMSKESRLRNGFAKLWKTYEFRKLIGGRVKRGVHKSDKCGEVNYRSSLELRFMQMLDHNPNVLSYEYETVEIEYLQESKLKRYYPDFKIYWLDGNIEIVEIFALSHYDDKILKFNAGNSYCEANGFSYSALHECELYDYQI